jgi:hypothetical protein
MYTREDYMRRRCSHEEYYGQYVNNSIRMSARNLVCQYKVTRLQYEKDPHLNFIPLGRWECVILGSNRPLVAKSLQDRGDFLSPAVEICIAKEAARQVLEEEK